jgi:cytidylate kinase
MIRIITMEREYGAGGSAIALKLAEQLKWKLWDEALTAEIARLANCDQHSIARLEERVDPLFYRLMKVFMRGSHERSLPVNGLENLDADSMVVFMQRVIERAAAAGDCVIVGRGAPYLLRNRPDAFHVFVYAPIEEKIRRVRNLGKTQAEAVELVDAIDQERATFVKKYFGKDWPSRQLYHLMINSAVGDDVVVRTILDAMATLDQAKSKAASEPGVALL